MDGKRSRSFGLALHCCPRSLLIGPISICCSGVSSGWSVTVIPELPLSLCKCTGSFLFIYLFFIVANIKGSDPIIKPMAIIKIVHVEGPTCLFPIGASFSLIVSNLRNNSFKVIFLKGANILGIAWSVIFGNFLINGSHRPIPLISVVLIKGWKASLVSNFSSA